MYGINVQNLGYILFKVFNKLYFFLTINIDISISYMHIIPEYEIAIVLFGIIFTLIELILHAGNIIM